MRFFPVEVFGAVGGKEVGGGVSYDAFLEHGYNVLIEGDNRVVLSSLLSLGYGGCVDLIYCDPPFCSGVDYVRRVGLRGKCDRGGRSISQVQYGDVWGEGEYLAFMHARLVLMRELLSERGSLYLHCDWHQSHHLRLLLDKVFGSKNFRNEVTWRRQITRGRKVEAKCMPHNADYLFLYSKSEDVIWHPIKKERFISLAEAERKYQKDGRGYFRTSAPGTYSNESLIKLYKEGRIYVTNGGRVEIEDGVLKVIGGRLAVKYYREKVGNKIREEVVVDNIWDDIPGMGVVSGEYENFPTQKPERLLERIVRASSDVGSIVLDCFCGSGTTGVVAERLGRRWVMADVGRGAVQTSVKRLQGVIDARSGDLLERARGFVHYRVKGCEGHLDGVVSECSAEVDVRVVREGRRAVVSLVGYRSVSIRLKFGMDEQDGQVGDFRSQIDSVFLDTDYNGEYFDIVISDFPKKKDGLIRGEYEVLLPRVDARIAVKVVDILGEEVVRVV